MRHKTRTIFLSSADILVCDDMARAAENKGLDLLHGREADLKLITSRMFSATPKLAILGPSGSGKTQLVDYVALALAPFEPITSPADRPTPKVRLLRLDLDRLAFGEEMSQGSAARTLREARAEVGKASESNKSGTPGIKYVIVIGMCVSLMKEIMC